MKKNHPVQISDRCDTLPTTLQGTLYEGKKNSTTSKVMQGFKPMCKSQILRRNEKSKTETKSVTAVEEF